MSNPLYPKDSSWPDFSVCGIFQEEYWSGLLFPALGDLPASLASPELAGRFSTSAPPGKPTLEISSGTTPSFYRTGELRLREAM